MANDDHLRLTISHMMMVNSHALLLATPTTARGTTQTIGNISSKYGVNIPENE